MFQLGIFPRNVLGFLGFLGGSTRNQWLRVKTSKKGTSVGEDSDDELGGLGRASDLEEEEKIMDMGTSNEEGSENAVEVIDAIEQELSEDIANATKLMKPVQCVLVKVCSHSIPFTLIFFDSQWTIT